MYLCILINIHVYQTGTRGGDQNAAHNGATNGSAGEEVQHGAVNAPPDHPPPKAPGWSTLLKQQQAKVCVCVCVCVYV